MLRVLTLFALLAPHLPVHAAPLGQWVWSHADLAPLTAARNVRPDLGAAVQVAELYLDHDVLRSKLRLSPTLANAHTAVIRFSAVYRPDPARTLETAELLTRILTLVRRTAPQVHTLQLDYDCPTAQLPHWAALLRTLQERRVFAGFELWMTSLVAHLRDPRFGPLFRELVRGHIVQVFDTAEVASPEARAELTQLLQRTALPFCLGLGAFERGRTHVASTQHEAWWSAARELAQSPQFRGTWVFAAGKPWSDRATVLP